MIFIKIVQLVLMILFIGGLISQVLIPAVRGTPSFPMFRSKREGELESEAAALRQKKVEADLAKQNRKLG